MIICRAEHSLEAYLVALIQWWFSIVEVAIPQEISEKLPPPSQQSLGGTTKHPIMQKMTPTKKSAGSKCYQFREQGSIPFPIYSKY